MTTAGQRCGTCVHRRPYFDSSIGEYLNGLKKPCAWRGAAPFYMLALNRWVYEDEGKDCPTWQPR